MTVEKCQDKLVEATKKEQRISVTMKKFPGYNILKGICKYFNPGAKQGQIYVSLIKGNRTSYKISEDTGIDKSSVNRYLQDLMRYDIVEIEREVRRGRQIVTYYSPLFWDLDVKSSYEGGNLVCSFSFKSTRKKLCSRCSIGIKVHKMGKMAFTDDEVIEEFFKFRVSSKKQEERGVMELIDFKTKVNVKKSKSKSE